MKKRGSRWQRAAGPVSERWQGARRWHRGSARVLSSLAAVPSRCDSSASVARRKSFRAVRSHAEAEAGDEVRCSVKCTRIILIGSDVRYGASKQEGQDEPRSPGSRYANRRRP